MKKMKKIYQRIFYTLIVVLCLGFFFAAQIQYKDGEVLCRDGANNEIKDSVCFKQMPIDSHKTLDDVLSITMPFLGILILTFWVLWFSESIKR